MAIGTLGSLTVSLEANIAKFNKSLNKAEQQSKRRSKAIKNAFKGLAITVSVAGLTRAIDKSLDFADAIGKAAEKVGLSAEAFQTYDYAAGQAGVNTDKLTGALGTFNKRLGDLKGGFGPMLSGIQEVNPELATMMINAGSTEEALDIFMQALAAVEDPAQRASLAAAAFGKAAGIDMVNLVADGYQAMEDLRQKAVDLGLVLSDDLVQGAEDANDAMDTLSKVIGVKFTAAIVKNAPEIEAFANNLLKAFGAAEKGIGLFADNAGLALANFRLGMQEVTDQLPEVVEKFRAFPEVVVGYFESLYTDALGFVDDLISEVKSLVDARAEAMFAAIETAVEKGKGWFDFSGDDGPAAQTQAMVDDVGAASSKLLAPGGMVGYAEEAAAKTLEAFEVLTDPATGAPSLVATMADEVLKEAERMADELVVHSIIPDMVDASVLEFERLDRELVTKAGETSGEVVAAFESMAEKSVAAVEGMSEGMAQAMEDAIGAGVDALLSGGSVEEAVKGVGKAIMYGVKGEIVLAGGAALKVGIATAIKSGSLSAGVSAAQGSIQAAATELATKWGVSVSTAAAPVMTTAGEAAAGAYSAGMMSETAVSAQIAAGEAATGNIAAGMQAAMPVLGAAAVVAAAYMGHQHMKALREQRRGLRDEYKGLIEAGLAGGIEAAVEMGGTLGEVLVEPTNVAGLAYLRLGELATGAGVAIVNAMTAAGIQVDFIVNKNGESFYKLTGEIQNTAAALGSIDQAAAIAEVRFDGLVASMTGVGGAGRDSFDAYRISIDQTNTAMMFAKQHAEGLAAVFLEKNPQIVASLDQVTAAFEDGILTAEEAAEIGMKDFAGSAVIDLDEIKEKANDTARGLDEDFDKAYIAGGTHAKDFSDLTQREMDAMAGYVDATADNLKTKFDGATTAAEGHIGGLKSASEGAMSSMATKYGTTTAALETKFNTAADLAEAAITDLNAHNVTKTDAMVAAYESLAKQGIDPNTASLGEMLAAINALHDRTINIHTNYTHSGNQDARAMGTYGQYVTVPPGYPADSYSVGFSSGEKYKTMTQGEQEADGGNMGLMAELRALRMDVRALADRIARPIVEATISTMPPVMAI